MCSGTSSTVAACAYPRSRRGRWRRSSTSCAVTVPISTFREERDGDLHGRAGPSQEGLQDSHPGAQPPGAGEGRAGAANPAAPGSAQGTGAGMSLLPWRMGQGATIMPVTQTTPATSMNIGGPFMPPTGPWPAVGGIPATQYAGSYITGPAGLVVPMQEEERRYRLTPEERQDPIIGWRRYDLNEERADGTEHTAEL